MRDNVYVRRYYRRPNVSWREAIVIGFGRLHNETINIYSHFVGFWLFVLVTLYTLVRLEPRLVHAALHETHWGAVSSAASGGAAASLTGWLHSLPHIWLHRARAGHSAHDTASETASQLWQEMATAHRRAMLPMLLAAMVCLLSSTLFHTFNHVSRKSLQVLARVDYAGIALLVGGHAIMHNHFGFYCSPEWIRPYGWLTAVATAWVITAVLMPGSDSPRRIVARTFLFIGQGFLVSTALVHQAHLYGASSREFTHHFVPLAAACILYMIAGLVFAFRVPERWFPGAFDLAFNSHNILHFLVLIAAWVHWRGCVHAMHYRVSYDCLHAIKR